MQRLLAVLLVLIGLTGLVLGRLGETTWAPATETTATVDLSGAGPAVVIDPGVLYVGGEQGEVVIEGASDVSVITANNADIDAYLEGVHHTRVTGASDWTTLSTEDVDPEGADELKNPTSSDLWRTVETSPSPTTIDVGEFHAAENGKNEQVYRSLLIVTDGTQQGAEKISITWPVDAENEWVPFAYAGGAAIAVIGLVLLVVSLGGRRRDEDELEDGEPAVQEPAVAGAAAGSGGAVAGAESDADGAQGAGLDELFTDTGEKPREENVWSLGADSTASGDSVAPRDSDAPSTEDAQQRGESAEDRTQPIDPVDDGGDRR